MGVNVLDYSTLTISSTAQNVYSSASPVMPDRTRGAIMVCEDEQWRYRLDGTDPTATEGILKNAGEEVVFDSWSPPGNNWRWVLKNMSVIRVVNDGKLKIHWYD